MKTARLVIAGTQSGVGKTSVALALMAAYKRAGLQVQPFKVGPDYIDPSYHKVATGVPSHNLDSWLLSKENVQRLFLEKSENCDIALIEGVMGLYDGLGTKEETASTQEIAKLLGAPILLVIDSKGMSRSGAAMALGYKKFDSELTIGAIILNKVSSLSHYKILKEAIEHYTGIPVVGGISKNENLKIPERHLGLLTAEENPELEACINQLVSVTHANSNWPGFDLEKILKIADEGSRTEIVFKKGARPCGLAPLRTFPYASEKLAEAFLNTISASRASIKIGVARDRAFSFYYQANLDLLEKMGAELVYFSPLRDKKIPEGCSALYFGGGFPEIYAEELVENISFMNSIKSKIALGLPIYAECGGLMYLSESIQILDGKTFSMVGAVPGKITMTQKLQKFGYKEGRLLKDTLLGKEGNSIRGHEFHYSERSANLESYAYELKGRRNVNLQLEGYSKGNILASYLHLHFLTNPDWAIHWIQAAISYNGADLFSSPKG